MPSGADSTAAARAVEGVLQQRFFGAVARYDYAGVRGAVTPAFELTEDTLRLSADQFLGLVRGFEGKATIVYRLDGFATRVAWLGGEAANAVAWTTYRNHGTFTPAGGQPVPLEWLETAVLIRDSAGVWRIDRLHSTSLRSTR